MQVAFALLLTISGEGLQLPSPEAGQESYTEALDLLDEAEGAVKERLWKRAAHQAGGLPYKLLLEVERLGVLPTAVRPLPTLMPRPDTSEESLSFVAAAASSLAYEPGEGIRERAKRWGYTRVELFESTVGTRAWIGERAEHVLVVFCGTEDDGVDAIADLSIDTIRGPHYGGGRVHRGFEAQLRAIWGEIEPAIKAAKARAPQRPFVFTGHSLGGALATLAYARTRTMLLFPSLIGGAPSARLITFGTPRSVDEALATSPVFRKDALLRVVHRNDPVPEVFPELVGYRHPDSRVVYFTADNKVSHDAKLVPGVLEAFSVADHNENNYAVMAERWFKLKNP